MCGSMSVYKKRKAVSGGGYEVRWGIAAKSNTRRGMHGKQCVATQYMRCEVAQGKQGGTMHSIDSEDWDTRAKMRHSLSRDCRHAVLQCRLG